jgi:hypothetical protein
VLCIKDHSALAQQKRRPLTDVEANLEAVIQMREADLRESDQLRQKLEQEKQALVKEK